MSTIYKSHHLRLNHYQHFLRDYHNSVSNAPFVAHQYLTRAMYAATSSARCHMEIEEPNTAKRDLERDIIQFQTMVLDLVQKLLGDKRAIFFHQEFSDETVKRFNRAWRWLISQFSDDKIDDLQVILDHRKDFWNNDLMPQRSRISIRKLGRGKENDNDWTVAYLKSLEHAESLIENFQCLEGYLMELRYLRLSNTSFREWVDWTDMHLRQSGSELAIFRLAQEVDLQ